MARRSELAAGRDSAEQLEDDAFVDPNYTGAFAGGPPLYSAEKVRHLYSDPKKVEQLVKQRYQALLEKESGAVEGK